VPAECCWRYSSKNYSTSPTTQTFAERGARCFTRSLADSVSSDPCLGARNAAVSYRSTKTCYRRELHSGRSAGRLFGAPRLEDGAPRRSWPSDPTRAEVRRRCTGIDPDVCSVAVLHQRLPEERSGPGRRRRDPAQRVEVHRHGKCAVECPVRHQAGLRSASAASSCRSRRVLRDQPPACTSSASWPHGLIKNALVQGLQSPRFKTPSIARRLTAPSTW